MTSKGKQVKLLHQVRVRARDVSVLDAGPKSSHHHPPPNTYQMTSKVKTSKTRLHQVGVRARDVCVLDTGPGPKSTHHHPSIYQSINI
jgi:hypothetical protein